MVMISNPVYKPTAGVCMNGLYPGFSVGRGGTGAMHNVISAFESFRNTNVEVVSVGLPNDIDGGGGSGVDSFIRDMQGLPQHIVATLPLGPLDGSFSLSDVISGSLDSKYITLFTKLVAAGWTGDRMTIRLGWEWDGNWTWGLSLNDPSSAFIDHVTGAKNTPAKYKAAFRRVVGIARELGFTGAFDWNGPTPNTSNMATYLAVFPGNDFGANRTGGGGCQIVGNDFYSTISNGAFYSTDDPADVDSSGNHKFNAAGTPGFPPKYRYGLKKNDYLTVWQNEALARFTAVCTFARSNGLLVGIAECGQIINHASRYASNDNAVYWQKLHDAIVANADVVCYVCPFNQVIRKSGVVTEDDAMFVWNGTTGTAPSTSWTGETVVATNASGTMSPAGATLGQAPPSMGTYDNGNSNTTGTWAVSPSANQRIGTPVYQSLFQAGSMVYATPAPTYTYHHRLENFPNASSSFTSLFAGPVTTSPWTSPPSAPVGVTVARTNATAVVSWSPPTFDGGSPITGYVVTRSGVNSSGIGPFTSAVLPASTRSLSLIGLTASSYGVTVYAVSSSGNGAVATAAIPALGGPSAVTDVAVQVLSAGSIQATWTPVPNAVAYDVTIAAGALIVTGDLYSNTYSDLFVATAIPTGSTVTTLVDSYRDVYANTYGTPTTSGGVVLTPALTLTVTDPSVLVTGLLPSTQYVVHVVARNAVGVAPSSPNVPFTTLATDSGSGSPVDSAPPALVLPQPDSNAFPVGASFRPVNFGAKVANNG